MATFPERLRELRTQRGFSQQDLADRTDQTKQAISQYERGVRRPDMDMLLALCDIFNVSLDYLTGKEDVTPQWTGHSRTLTVRVWRYVIIVTIDLV